MTELTAILVVITWVSSAAAALFAIRATQHARKTEEHLERLKARLRKLTGDRDSDN